MSKIFKFIVWYFDTLIIERNTKIIKKSEEKIKKLEMALTVEKEFKKKMCEYSLDKVRQHIEEYKDFFIGGCDD